MTIHFLGIDHVQLATPEHNSTKDTKETEKTAIDQNEPLSL